MPRNAGIAALFCWSSLLEGHHEIMGIVLVYFGLDWLGSGRSYESATKILAVCFYLLKRLFGTPSSHHR